MKYFKFKELIPIIFVLINILLITHCVISNNNDKEDKNNLSFLESKIIDENKKNDDYNNVLNIVWENIKKTFSSELESDIFIFKTEPEHIVRETYKIKSYVIYLNNYKNDLYQFNNDINMYLLKDKFFEIINIKLNDELKRIEKNRINGVILRVFNDNGVTFNDFAVFNPLYFYYNEDDREQNEIFYECQKLVNEINNKINILRYNYDITNGFSIWYEEYINIKEKQYINNIYEINNQINEININIKQRTDRNIIIAIAFIFYIIVISIIFNKIK